MSDTSMETDIQMQESWVNELHKALAALNAVLMKPPAPWLRAEIVSAGSSYPIRIQIIQNVAVV